MNSGVLRLLYTNAFNDVELARNYQISISQKEMEINMIDINSRYSSFDNVYLNNIKKQTLELDIINLKNNRDKYINSAISYALTIADNEIQENNTFSTAAIVIGSISSFISTVKNSFNISITNSTNLSLLSNKLVLSGFHMFQLKRAINDLKSSCNVF